VSDSEELRVIVYEGDGGFVAICPSYPGITGEGPTREACVENLQRNIELHVSGGSHGG
jgi:predicted RNase H-like HicB family nuclease